MGGALAYLPDCHCVHCTSIALACVSLPVLVPKYYPVRLLATCRIGGTPFSQCERGTCSSKECIKLVSAALVQAPGAPGALVQVTALACGAAAVLEALREAGLAAAVPNESPGSSDHGGVPASSRLAAVAEAVQAALSVLEAALAAAGAAEVAALPELGACVVASGVPSMLEVGRRLLRLQMCQTACAQASCSRPSTQWTGRLCLWLRGACAQPGCGRCA